MGKNTEEYEISNNRVGTLIITEWRKNLTCFHRRTEDVRVLPIVVTELKLGNIQRQIFGGNFVVGAYDATFQDGPETLNSLGVDGANNILTASMVNRPVREFLAQIAIRAMLIGAKQADLFGNALANEGGECGGGGVLNHTGNHIPLTAHGTSHDFFARTTTSILIIATLVFVTVLRFAAHIGFINLHDAHQLSELLISKTSADTHAHVMRGAVGAETHHALDLEGGNPLFADQHEMDDAEPYTEINVCVLEDGANKVGKPIRRAYAAIHALPFVSLGFQLDDMQRAAAGAVNAILPAFLDQIRIASRFIGEHCLELWNGELLDARHGFCPLMIGIK